MAILEVPFTLASKLEKLKILGLIGVVGIVIFISAFVLYYILCSFDLGVGSEPQGGMELFPNDWFGVAAAVPNILFAITFQNNFYPLFKGLKNSSDKRMVQVTFSGVLFCAISYLIIGLLGYNYIGNGV